MLNHCGPRLLERSHQPTPSPQTRISFPKDVATGQDIDQTWTTWTGAAEKSPYLEWALLGQREKQRKMCYDAIEPESSAQMTAGRGQGTERRSIPNPDSDTKTRTEPSRPEALPSPVSTARSERPVAISLQHSQPAEGGRLKGRAFRTLSQRRQRPTDVARRLVGLRKNTNSRAAEHRPSLSSIFIDDFLFPATG